MASILTLNRLSAGYGTLRILSGIDFEIEEGERVGIVGLNGHGKSTLLRAIVGLVEWRSGEVAYRGQSIGAWPTHRLVAEGIVLIPQGDALFPGLTVRENLDAGALSSGPWRDRGTRRERVLDLFPSLRPRLRQAAGTLSGGERRMLSIGRGLMRDAELYLVDEPSLGLAPGIARRLLDVLTTLDLRGRALILAEQDLTLIEGRLDRVIGIHGGKIATDLGSAESRRAAVERQMAAPDG